MSSNNEKYSTARYIRDTNLGVDGDPTYRCSEISVYDPKGINIAPKGIVSFTCNLPNIDEASYNNAERANNGVIETNNIAMCKISTPTNPNARKGIVLDLGDSYEIDKINIKHSWLNEEVYVNNVVEISNDGLNWIVVQDSNMFGNYSETVDGLEIVIPYGIGSVDGNGNSGIEGMIQIMISESKPLVNNIVWFEVVNSSIPPSTIKVDDEFNPKSICKIKM